MIPNRHQGQVTGWLFCYLQSPNTVLGGLMVFSPPTRHHTTTDIMQHITLV